MKNWWAWRRVREGRKEGEQTPGRAGVQVAHSEWSSMGPLKCEKDLTVDYTES